MKLKFLTASFIFFLFSSLAIPFPRFSAYTGDKCADCHYNPSGGSMRNKYGINFAKKFLGLDVLKKYSISENFDPQITKNFSLGGDVRMVYSENQMTNQSTQKQILTMQGDLYLNATVNKYITVFIAPGIQIPSVPTKPEVYGMVSNLPLFLYLKAGRFIPNYGTRIPEHRAFQRADLLNAPHSADAGLEIGFSPIPQFDFSIGIFNGLRTQFFDADPKKMAVMNGSFYTVINENFNMAISSFLYSNPFNYLDPNTGFLTDASNRAIGGSLRFGVLQKICLIGEVNFLETRLIDVLTRSLYYFNEFDIMIIKGFELRYQFEYKDPNRDLSTDRLMRHSFGFSFFPLFGLETETMLRFLIDDRAENTNELQINFHFYF
jgi:hypothetical protein